MSDDKVWQEFYCGQCSGYFRVRLNMALNHIVMMVCPKCKHQHKRCIKNGQIIERGREQGEHVEEICPPISAYTKEPFTKKMEKAAGWGNRRDGVVIEEEEEKDVPERNAWSTNYFRERWLERFGG